MSVIVPNPLRASTAAQAGFFDLSQSGERPLRHITHSPVITVWNLLPSAPLTRGQTECVMDWNRIEGNWKQFKGQAKEKWGRLTDDDLDVVNGQQEQLEGKIQERYGLAKDQAKKDVDAWFKSLP
jgi:uncharacterized protein YjbJ (UPF0337 family)